MLYPFVRTFGKSYLRRLIRVKNKRSFIMNMMKYGCLHKGGMNKGC